MARIAEDLLLLLLDNESAQPRLRRTQLGRVLAAALLLDLAYGCRVRPAVPSDAVAPGHLVALAGPVPMDPAVRPALAVIEQGAPTPAAALRTLRKRAEDDVVDQLLRTGAVHQIQLSSHRLRRNTYAWPMRDRERADRVRAAITSALAHGQRPDVITSAIIALLHTVGGLQAALNLHDDDARRASQRAEEITFGGWADGSGTAAEINLAVTAASVLPALG